MAELYVGSINFSPFFGGVYPASRYYLKNCSEKFVDALRVYERPEPLAVN